MYKIPATDLALNGIRIYELRDEILPEGLHMLVVGTESIVFCIVERGGTDTSSNGSPSIQTIHLSSAGTEMILWQYSEAKPVRMQLDESSSRYFNEKQWGSL
ncbi:hypothetical protein WUBG_02967 [Wuchereria bancrofti]|uniref:Uncharacterized protein n=1 Tax=Wuchereria bancrofti TaxID=6293 RepID=J9EU74_WUCBA|nr:hypothetical protein WUBG_02967 [Wuchereria bancrofti]